MEALLSRYRNLTVLLIVVVGQLLYLGYQVKTNRDERLIRVWAVTAVTPMAGIVEALRRNTIGFLQDYFILLDVREQNRHLKSDNDHLRLENVYFRNELATAEHARALTLFQAQSPSKTIAARVIGNSTVATAKAVFIDRGSTSGIEKGMAVVVPDGIIGKVDSVYPLVAQVLLVSDPTFKVGVESQKGHIHGILNCETGKCSIEQIQNEEKVDGGEWFFTSGEDRIFPKGFPVGTVVSAQPGQGMKDIRLTLSGAPGAVEEVLVVLTGVHQQIPATPVPVEATVSMLPPPPEDGKTSSNQPVKPQTEADKILQKYDALGKEEGHVYGGVGSNLPDFNAKPAAEAAKDQKPASPAAPNTDQKVAETPKPAPAPSRPEILGARPGSKLPAEKPAASPQAKPATPQPVLPLGAPRRKPAGGSTSTRPPQ